MFKWDASLLPVSNILRKNDFRIAQTGGSQTNLTQVLQRSTFLEYRKTFVLCLQSWKRTMICTVKLIRLKRL